MFNGNNDESSTIRIAMERAKYHLRAFGSIQGPVTTLDINFAEANFYGRVDSGGNSIYPNPEFIVPAVRVSRNDVPAPMVNEVVNFAFDKMRANAHCKILFQTITTENDQIAAMTPHRAYESPYDGYSTYLSNQLVNFNEDFIPFSYGTNNITSFNDYVKALMIYFHERYTNLPITFTAWNLSGYNSVFSTGLALSIAPNNFEDDSIKEEFLNNQLYPYYEKLALNSGLGIVKQAPQVLLLDVGSPALNANFRHHGVASTGEFFAKYFNPTLEQDLPILRRKIVDYYNDFVTLNKIKRSFSSSCGKTITKVTRRQNISNLKYINSNNWLIIYLKLRNIENNIYINKHDLKTMQKKVINLAKKVDNREAMSYIDNVFTPLHFKKPYGIYWYSDRLRKRILLEEQKTLGKTKGSSISFSTGGSSGGSSGGY